MADVCTHLDQVTVPRPETVEGCEECLRTGVQWSYCFVDDASFVLSGDPS